MSEKDMRYGIQIRAHPEFVSMLKSMKAELAVKNRGLKFSDTALTKMISDNFRPRENIIDWRLPRWR